MKDDNKKIDKIFAVQDHQLKSGRKVLFQMYAELDKLKKLQSSNSEKLLELENKISLLLAEYGLSLDDFNNLKETSSLAKLTSEELAEIEKKVPKFQRLEIVECEGDWNTYIQNIDRYIQKHQLNLEKNIITQIFTPSDLIEIEKKYDLQFGSIKWNKFDYMAVFLAVSIAFALDYFIVSIPKDETFLGKEYKGSPITKFFLKQKEKIAHASEKDNNIYGWLKKAQTFLEKKGKVPYDFPADNPEVLGTSVDGLSPKTHRVQTFGHDPVLGFVIGVLDIMKAQMTVIDREGKIHIIDRSEYYEPQSFFNAIILQIIHLLSDIFTPQGLPAPFLSVLQCLTKKSPFILKENGKQISYNDLARYMYVHGYTLDHFITMSIVPLFIELFIKTYYKLFYFKTLFLKKDRHDLKKDAKLQSMLTFAHALASTTNVLKMWLLQWNPLAFNTAQFLKAIQSFYALFKAYSEREKKIERELFLRWEKLYYEICK